MKKDHFLLLILGIIIISALTLRLTQKTSKPDLSFDNEPLPVDYSSEAEVQVSATSSSDELLGSDRDNHDCIGSAGYSWCESKQKCLRIWEEDCPEFVDSMTELGDIKDITEISVAFPLPGDLASSPLKVVGKARGSWFFEASLPVRLVTASGTTIVSHYGEAGDDWMTNDFVNFTSDLVFETTATSGYLIVAKDNPSGLPEYDNKITIPIKFK